MEILERFLNYARINTPSMGGQKCVPSTQCQFDLANVLVEELKALGLTQIELDDKCYLSAVLPSNTDKKVPIIGFNAHIDTVGVTEGLKVNPIVWPKYDGGDLLLNAEKNIVLSPNQFSYLADYIGQTIITTDGLTVLGGDDKAGIAEIMTMLENFVNNPQLKHGEIRVAFTPDEEIGTGGVIFDVKKFGADYAYTVDSGEIGKISYETFNAAHALLKVKGVSVHPGASKDLMKNAVMIAMDFLSLIPPFEQPFHTEGYEGFYHVNDIKGSVANCEVNIALRDHDRALLEKRKEYLKSIAVLLNQRYGEGTVSLEIHEQYVNMAEFIRPMIEIVDNAITAMKECGVEPKLLPTRGGTDGAHYSAKGMPTPNIFVGGHNYHGCYEFIPLESMQKSAEVLTRIVTLAEEQGK